MLFWQKLTAPKKVISVGGIIYKGIHPFAFSAKGSDLKDDNAHHDHESYYGDRDTESLVKLAMVVSLVEPIHLEPHNLALEDKSDNSSRTLKKAPSTGGCRVEGYMRVKKVPGNLMVSARSGSHSFDSSQMNMSHVVNHLSFGRRIMPQKFSEFKRLSPYEL